LAAVERGHTKSRLLLNGEQRFCRLDDERCEPIKGTALAAILRTVERAGDYDAVLIADYAKGVCTHEVLRMAIEAANYRDVPVLVDPGHGVPWCEYVGATVIKCNADEEQMGGSQYAKHVIVTRGSQGMDLDGELVPTDMISAADVCGCGDTVLATLGVCLASGIGLPDGCRLANRVAGAKCRKRGAVPVSIKELRCP
jgi:D-beta-D-heptose 7-phosphate kinase/D-beta-D-heptose 1-phosphate adenosyltransferase